MLQAMSSLFLSHRGHSYAPCFAASTLALVVAIMLGTGCPAGPGQEARQGQAGPAAAPAGAVPEEVIVLNSLGAAAMGQQELEKAIAQFGAAVAKRPNDPLLLSNLALAEMQKGMFDEAQAHLEQALAVDPGYVPAQFRMGLVLKNSGATEEAIGEFEKVEKSDPFDIVTLYQLGSLKTRGGDAVAGIADFERALALDPTHVSALYGLGRAYMTKGDTEKGAAILAKSQKMKDELGAGDTVGLQYGEQGKYSIATEYPASALAAPADLSMTFEPVAGAIPGVEAVQTARPLLLNADGDALADLVLVQDGVVKLYLGNGDGTFKPGPGLPALKSGDPAATSVVAADLSNDGTMDLLVLCGGAHLWKGKGAGAFEDATKASGLSKAGGSPQALVSDFDHDGDLDVILTAVKDGRPELDFFVNAGAGTFSRRSEIGLQAGSGAEVFLAATDFDNDRDVDVAVAVPGSGAEVLLNRRDTTYDEIGSALAAPAIAGASGLSIADVNKDGMMDLLVPAAGGARLLANRLGHKAEEIAGFSAAAGKGDVTALVACDFDNDGFLDVALLSGPGGAPALTLIRNLGAGNWTDESGKTGLKGASIAAGAGASGVDSADIDGDGDMDLVAGASVLRNQGGEKNHHVAIALKGLGDNRFGAGTKVEIRAGSLWQRFEAGTSGLPVHMGLGTHEKVDAVRMLWMGGVLQDEVEVQTGQPFEIAQLDRKGTSCPILYAWNGERIQFVTDFLGGSAYGYLETPGVWSVPDTDEYVKIRGDQLVARAGVFDLRLVNQLEEVIIFDRAQLLVVDHPASVDIFPNERLMPAPPFPQPRIYTSEGAQAPAWARDDAGRDMTDAVRAEDRRTVDTFELLPPKGYSRPHALEIGLGDGPGPAGAGQMLLLLDGWIDYADSTSNVAASQAGLVLTPPSLDARRPGGAWRTVIASTGFPAGLPKTMSLDLTGLLKPGENEVRIATSMRIYWDRVRVATQGAGAETRVTKLEPMRADLAFLGFPRPVTPDGHKPFAYDYASIARSAPWKAHSGAYTRFGDVRPLLASVDDRYVVTKNGDQITLAFDASAAPPLPAGWSRDFLLFTDGFGKDMDPNSATPAMVGPLPYHAMNAYPYAASASFSADPVRAAWLDEWNTRIVPADILGCTGVTPPAAGARLR